MSESDNDQFRGQASLASRAVSQMKDELVSLDGKINASFVESRGTFFASSCDYGAMLEAVLSRLEKAKNKEERALLVKLANNVIAKSADKKEFTGFNFFGASVFLSSASRLIPVLSLAIGGGGALLLSVFKADSAIVWGFFVFAVVFAAIGYLDSRRDQIDE